MTRSNPVAATTSSTVTPGWTDSSRIRWEPGSQSNEARLDTTRRSRMYRVAAGPALAALSHPTPATMSTLAVKTRGECLGTQ